VVSFREHLRQNVTISRSRVPRSRRHLALSIRYGGDTPAPRPTRRRRKPWRLPVDSRRDCRSDRPTRSNRNHLPPSRRSRLRTPRWQVPAVRASVRGPHLAARRADVSARRFICASNPSRAKPGPTLALMLSVRGLHRRRLSVRRSRASDWNCTSPSEDNGGSRPDGGVLVLDTDTLTVVEPSAGAGIAHAAASGADYKLNTKESITGIAHGRSLTT
jgi:hypothetical protein